MNTLLRAQRDRREIDDAKLKAEERKIQKLMVSYGYDYDNAKKALEINKIRNVEAMFGAAAGAFAVYKVQPILKEMQVSFPLMRKAWMRYPLPIALFAVTYHVATMLPQKFGRKFSTEPTITHDTYTGKFDLVGKFRFYEDSPVCSAEDKLARYASAYSTEALTEPEIIAKIAGKPGEEAPKSNRRVRRLGPDADPHYWMFGKIHGLENICFLSDEQLRACAGNPVLLQEAINNVVIPKGQAQTVEQREATFQAALQRYKQAVSSRNLTVSDRKKLLSLPFFMMKRQEQPEPKRGQNEWALFEELYGASWDAFDHLEHDPEEKITEFNYEKYISADVLATMDTDSEDFKDMIRSLNFSTKTKYEQHKANQQKFSSMMPLLAQLNAREQRDLVHILESESSKGQYLDQLCDGNVERELAKLSEAENYAAKNHYVHKNRTLKFADSKKMPVDERKVKDMLRNQHIFRDRMNSEIGTYQDQLDKPNLEHGILTYVNEAAYGEMRDLIRDVGINKDSIPFYNIDRMEVKNKNLIHGSDSRFTYLVNGMFTPLDMTDQEESCVGWHEIGDDLPINRQSWLKDYQEEAHPQSDQLSGIEVVEKRPLRYTSSTYASIMAERYADKPEEPEPEYGQEGDDDDYDEEGDGEEEEEAEPEYGDYGEYDAEIDDQSPWPQEDTIPHVKTSDRYFLGDKTNQGLRDNFSDVEIGAFMKVLNVKPHNQWEDKNTHHYKLGTHEYEDEAQELDPQFHILSEPERKEAELARVRKWRSGAEVRFEVGNKRPIHYNTRF